MNFHGFSAQYGSENDLKMSQDQSRTVPKTIICHVDLLLQFWIVLGSVLAPFWDPFGLQDRSKIGPKIDQNLSCGNMPLQDRPERPQDRPRAPKTTPSPPQELPRPPQDRPKSLPKQPQETPKPPKEASRSPQEHPRSSQSNLFSIVLNDHHFHKT